MSLDPDSYVTSMLGYMVLQSRCLLCNFSHAALVSRNAHSFILTILRTSLFLSLVSISSDIDPWSWSWSELLSILHLRGMLLYGDLYHLVYSALSYLHPCLFPQIERFLEARGYFLLIFICNKYTNKQLFLKISEGSQILLHFSWKPTLFPKFI